MITINNNMYVLDTDNTSYAFAVLGSGQLEHLYYGRKLHANEAVMTEKHTFIPGNTNVYNKDYSSYSLEDVCLEMSSLGKGDIREPFIEVTYPNGSSTTDMVFDRAEIIQGKEEYDTLPGSYDDNGEVEQLVIYLKDRNYNLTLEIHYYVYEKCDIITRSAKLVNSGNESVRLERLMSMQLDLNESDYELSFFNGAWAREMNRSRIPIRAGKYVNESVTGTSSNRANPFFMIGRSSTTEDYGECYGFNLIYSGNHYEAAQVNSYGKLRLVSGINPATFSYIIEAGKCFEAPEAVLTYSYKGYNRMSHNMHEFVRKHIVRGSWRDKERPVLINSWEAAYFNINERKLVKLAKAAKDTGVELFVMDDGWFGERNDDTSSLGDWTPNSRKLPNGIAGIADKIKESGLKFGIWVEPEMVSVNSRLYEAHPEWVIEIPDVEHSEGRNQRILDLTYEAVQDYIIEEMSEVFSSADISYVKWDMNRIFSDALCRAQIQYNYSYGYPLSSISAHVSASPNHQTLRNMPLESRFAVAAFGILGYECNMCDMNKEELNAVKCQIELYKKLRNVFFTGTFYRTESFEEENAGNASVLNNGKGNRAEWTVVSTDKKKAVGLIMQKHVIPNTQYACYRAKGLDEAKKYHFYNRKLQYDIKEFGELVNMVSPIHIKQGSMLQDILSKLKKMDGETEDYIAYGDTLMYSGVRLKQAFSATGYNENVRFFQDFAARLYFMEEVEDDKQ